MKKEQWNLAAPSDSLMTANLKDSGRQACSPCSLGKDRKPESKPVWYQPPVCKQHTGQRNALNCTRKNTGKSCIVGISASQRS